MLRPLKNLALIVYITLTVFETPAWCLERIEQVRSYKYENNTSVPTTGLIKWQDGMTYTSKDVANVILN